jgi:hypothetical protein
MKGEILSKSGSNFYKITIKPQKEKEKIEFNETSNSFIMK